jgi:hypothetical protein
MPSTRIIVGLLLALVGAGLAIFVSAVAGVIVGLVGAGLLLPLAGGREETGFTSEWSDSGGGHGGGF